MEAGVTLDTGEDYPEIREAVQRICAGYPGEYWRRLEDERAYPTEFVNALTEAGYLAALIPEEYGGSGMPLRAAAVILEAIHETGCSAGACHAQMYIMGALLRHGSEEQKRHYLPKIASGELRLQAFGVTEPGSGTDTTSLRTRAVRRGGEYVVNGQKVWTSRALQSDLMLLLARTTPIDQVEKRTLGLSIFLVDLREVRGRGCEIRPLPAMINHNTTEVFFQDMRIPASSLIGEEGRGFYYILDGHERGAHPARWERRSGMRATSRAAPATTPVSARSSGDPSAETRPSSFPSPAPTRKRWRRTWSTARRRRSSKPGRDCGAEANIAKLLSSEAAWNAAEAAMQTFGRLRVRPRVRPSSASGASAGSSRPLPFRPTSSCPTWGSTCSACRGLSRRLEARRSLQSSQLL